MPAVPQKVLWFLSLVSNFSFCHFAHTFLWLARNKSNQLY